MFGLECFKEEYEKKKMNHPFESLYSIQAGVCIRCGNHELESFPCVNCEKNCLYCRICLKNGISKSCRFLYRSIEERPKWQFADQTNWQEKLTEEQFKTATVLVQSIKEKKHTLLWAVCGSGKTEMIYPCISYALATGLSVCLATPRMDVVLELYPRFQSTFPHLAITALYGGSLQNRQWAPLVISTTHQLIHFHETFDVIILDEADAFPYSKDPSLPYYLQKAKKQHAPIITVTATPSRKQKRDAEHICLLPARYHRHPLPIPTMMWIGNWNKMLQKEKISPQLVKWLNQQISEKHQIFLFIPYAKEVSHIVQLLKEKGFLVEGVYSESPDRKEKVMAFRKKDYQICVTTTILERGITIENVSVAVLGAEAEVFTESALVQICGRGGRSKNAPTSSIVFFHNGMTVEMKRAVKHMKRMNTEAEKRGLLL